jgi:hypothetical protein
MKKNSSNRISSPIQNIYVMKRENQVQSKPITESDQIHEDTPETKKVAAGLFSPHGEVKQQDLQVVKH